MQEIGIGVVGCGYWGINYVRVFGELTDVSSTGGRVRARMLAVADTNPERLYRVRARFPSVATMANCSELLAFPEIDAVVVSTPSSHHYQVVKACLQAGKHVLVEKPFVMDVAEGAELIQLARDQQRVMMVGHTFLYNAGILKMRDYVQDAQCGEVYYLHATRTNLGPIRQDASALWDLVPHDVSIFSFLLQQQPLWVAAVGARYLGNCREDVGFVTLAYPGGVLGHIHVSWLDPNKVREVVVVGSKQRIVFNDLDNLERIRIFEKGVSPIHGDVNGFGEFQLRIRDGDIISPKVEVSEPLKNQCIHFLECLASGHNPRSNGQDGLDVVRVLVAIDQSIRQNGTPVNVNGSLPLPGAGVVRSASSANLGSLR